ncbi:hypothetical protein RB195_014369 [Necator americanus]|uniref:Reverse transcriptase domain-containing protein n=1 Tax=Necator americanus TaxID=51031 RepID=A0ABR1DZV7_NECAM
MESLATTIRIVTLNCRILSSELQQSAPSRLLRYPCVPFAALRETCMRDWAVISIENYTIYCGDADGNKIVIAHAPTETAEDNKKDAFYDELNALMSKIPTQKVFLVGFNANAKMGLEQQFDVIGKWYYPAEHPRNYRGISLLRVIYKVLERIILDRLVTRDEQAGFRRGRYTIDQVFIVRRVIEIWQRYSKPMQLAFLDFEATFDSPRRGRLLNALRADGVQGKFVRLLDDMNQRTTAAVRTPAGCTTPFEVVTGVRQEDWQDPSCLISPSTIYDYAKNSRSAFCWCRSSTIKIVAKLAAACGL